jgi:hypothetical protein
MVVVRTSNTRNRASNLHLRTVDLLCSPPRCDDAPFSLQPSLLAPLEEQPATKFRNNKISRKPL